MVWLRPPRSLRRRVVLLGVGTLVTALVALDLFVAIALRGELEDNVTALLAARLELATELAVTLDDESLAERLTALGIPAAVRGADGRVLRADPASPRFGSGAPAGADVPAGALPPPVVSRSAPLAGGGEVEVYATRAGAVGTFRDLLLFEVGGSLLVVLLAGTALWWLTSAAFRPLDEIVDVARATASGERGRRLRPERVDTELGVLAAAIDGMLDSLEETLAASEDQEARSRRFLADAAHQLRTPVAGMRASVETLLREPPTADRERLLVNLASEARRMGRLLTSLLRVAELDQGDAAVATPQPLVPVLRAEVRRAEERDDAHAYTLAVADGLDDVEVVAEPLGLGEALANLLDNARRHAERAVRVELLPGPMSDVLVRVVDDGPGVPAGSEELVFDRFVSLDGAGGSGLGLSIARGLVRSMGGDVAWRDRAMEVRLRRA